MIGNFTAYYLNRYEFKNAIEANRKFEASYSPHIIIHILDYFSESSFEAFVSNADYNSVPVYITEQNKRSLAIIQEYDKKESGVFTFDGIRFFKINNIATERTGDRKLVFTFQFINSPSFSEVNTAFMIMPFRYPQLNEFYKKNVKEFLMDSELKIKVSRSDDFTGADVVADTILEQIKKVEFIICDITNCNKNVFFEVGYAKGLGKKIIFLLEKDKPVEFFDVNHIRRIEYSYDRQNEFQDLLGATLINVRNNTAF